MSALNLPAFSVLVLGGGKSSRMGRDKALLELQGETLLARTIRLGESLGASQVLVSRNQPGFIKDQIKDAGPMAGISAGLSHCDSRWMLVLPVDMPLLSPEALTPLLTETLGAQQAGFIEGFPLPVLLENSPTLKSALERTLTAATSSRSLQRLWQQLGLRQLSLPISPAFQNCNDPASFAAICAALTPYPEHLATPTTGPCDDCISQ